MPSLQFTAAEGEAIVRALAAHNAPLAQRVREALTDARPPLARPSGSGVSTFGGRRDPSAVIGHAPEHRAWRPGDAIYQPEVAATARIEAFVTVDAGVSRTTSVGERTWLMKHVHVGHDAVVGDDCELAPGTVIGGSAEVGDRVKIGMNATVLPFRRLGDGCRIGAGAVVTRDVPAGEVWIGNPARPMEAHGVDKLRPVADAGADGGA